MRKGRLRAALFFVLTDQLSIFQPKISIYYDLDLFNLQLCQADINRVSRNNLDTNVTDETHKFCIFVPLPGVSMLSLELLLKVHNIILSNTC